MKIKYLGTASSEGIPALFCNCKVCNNALEKRGKEIKTRSQAIIDDKLLIDFPPDTYMHVLNYGLDLRKVHNLIITHTHSDHFYPNDFWCRLRGVANDIEEIPLNIYVSEAGYNTCKQRYGDNHPRLMVDGKPRLVFYKVTPFEAFDIEEYHIIPLDADHERVTNPVIYIIEKDNKSLLYAHDTGYFLDATWEYLSHYGKKFDCISLDCTGTSMNEKYGHMSLSANKEVCERLTEMGLIDQKTTIAISHCSCKGNLTHEQLAAEAEKLGFIAAYDGLEIEI